MSRLIAFITIIFFCFGIVHAEIGTSVSCNETKIIEDVQYEDDSIHFQSSDVHEADKHCHKHGHCHQCCSNLLKVTIVSNDIPAFSTEISTYFTSQSKMYSSYLQITTPPPQIS